MSSEATPPVFDHVALTVPDLDAQVDRLANTFGMTVESRSDRFAVISDPATGLKFELGKSEDAAIHFRHLGFRSADVDGDHAALVDAGMEAAQPPHRRDAARMYTSYLGQPGGLEVQLVRYD
jgi:catechol 2,3-dioxygenase-like lactoylglutathione lyase family enzyme